MSKSNPSKGPARSFLSGEQRINKLLAAAGFGSRRQVDELIVAGRVEVDGEIISQVGVKVDADVAKVFVDGEPLKRHKPVYYAVHKPAGYLCTNVDPEGRPRVIELVQSDARLFPVGRLDSSSTGLILLTNDGELSQRLAHPKHSVQKTYFVVVAGQVEQDAMRRLQKGIYLAEGVARVDGAKIRKVRRGCTEIDITLSEGKNREIRRVLARLGHKVVVLRRTAIGPLKLGDMPEGSYRLLHDKEVASLYQAVEDVQKARNQDRRERKKRSDELESKPRGDRPVQKPVRPVYDEEGDGWEEDDSLQADSVVESLPPMSKNPFRMSDDEDEQDDEAFLDSILVSDVDGDESFSSRRGAVLSYEDETDSGSEPSAPARPHRDRNERREGNAYQRGDRSNDRSGGRGEGRGGRTGGSSGRSGSPYGGASRPRRTPNGAGRRSSFKGITSEEGRRAGERDRNAPRSSGAGNRSRGGSRSSGSSPYGSRNSGRSDERTSSPYRSEGRGGYGGGRRSSGGGEGRTSERSGERPSRGGRPAEGGRPYGSRSESPRPSSGRPSGGWSGGARSSGGGSSGGRSSSSRSVGGKPRGGKPGAGRPSGGRPSGPGGKKPFGRKKGPR